MSTTTNTCIVNLTSHPVNIIGPDDKEQTVYKPSGLEAIGSGKAQLPLDPLADGTPVYTAQLFDSVTVPSVGPEVTGIIVSKVVGEFLRAHPDFLGPDYHTGPIAVYGPDMGPGQAVRDKVRILGVRRLEYYTTLQCVTPLHGDL